MVTNAYRNESYFPLKPWLRTQNPSLEGSDVCRIILQGWKTFCLPVRLSVPSPENVYVYVRLSVFFLF